MPLAAVPVAVVALAQFEMKLVLATILSRYH